MDYRGKFMVKPGEEVKLSKIDPDETFKTDKDAETLELTAKYTKELTELQNHLYAENRHSLLIVLQGMDAAGKDGVINHVLAPLNPQGCRCQPFKAPTELDLAHDFLWRVHRAAPRKGEIVIFNRSHYEDVLVQRVHNLVPKEVWSERYELINDFEKLLWKSGTTIVKFFLHISEEEQLKRFKQRLEDPERNWKISQSDYSERTYWDEYRKAFEEALSRCSFNHAPWYVIPSNHKYFRNLAISQILADTLRDLDMQMPPCKVDLEKIRQEYEQAAETIRRKKQSGHL